MYTNSIEPLNAVMRSATRFGPPADEAARDARETGGIVSARADQQLVVAEPRGFDAARSYLFVSAREPLAAAVAVWSCAGIVARAARLDSAVPLP